VTTSKPGRLAGIVATYRDAFGGLPRLTWLLCVAAFLNRCGSMVVPFLGLYAKEPPAIGGRVYERFGQHALWITCAVLGAVAAGMFWLASRPRGTLRSRHVSPENTKSP
jgi:hypothetical protein